MNIQHKSRLLWSVILIAWIFDLLFWKKEPGISFLIMVILTLVGGLLLSLGEGIRPAKNSWFLLIPVLFFSVMTVFREEPFTTFINYLLTVGAMALLAVTYTGGKWWNYSFSDYISNFFKLFLSAISKALMLFAAKEKKETDGSTRGDPGNHTKEKRCDQLVDHQRIASGLANRPYTGCPACFCRSNF